MKTQNEIKYLISHSPYGPGVQPVGRTPATVMVIKESPGFGESHTGISFASSTGSRFRSAIKNSDLEFQSFYYTNASKIERRNREIIKEHYTKYWKPILQSEIALTEPKYIIVFGNVPEPIQAPEGCLIINLVANAREKDITKTLQKIRRDLAKEEPFWEPGRERRSVE
jgi:uracil-DNA glycosylase family 4